MKDGLIPAANDMNWDAAEVHEIEVRFRKCFSTNREPAVLPVQSQDQGMGRPNEILRRDQDFVSDRNRQRRDAALIDLEEMFRTFFFCKKEARTKTPNPSGQTPNSESSLSLHESSPQEKEKRNPFDLEKSTYAPSTLT